MKLIAKEKYGKEERLRHVDIFEAWEKSKTRVDRCICYFKRGDLEVSQRRFLLQNGLTNVPSDEVDTDTFLIKYYEKK